MLRCVVEVQENLRPERGQSWMDGQFLGYVGQGVKLGTWLMREEKIEK